MTTVIHVCTMLVLWEHSGDGNKSGTVGEGITGKVTFNLGLEG